MSLSFVDDDTPRAPTPTPARDSEQTPGRARDRRQILLAGKPHTYRLRRSKRRTIGFQIDDAGLTVSAPRWVPLREIEAAILEKERWIRTKLSEWHEWRERRRLPAVQFVEGGRLPYLGGTVTLRLRPDLKVTTLAPAGADTELQLALPADADETQVKDAVQAWLQGEARRVFDQRIDVIAARSEVRPSSWALSSARSQWGSCTHDGRVRLNWRLIHFSVAVIDYVVAHELAHLKELNHGPRFWEAVSQLLPGFEAARDEIKDVDLAALPV